MIGHIVSRSRDESGFSLVELVMYMLILSIMIGTATYFFISVRDVNSVNSAGQEVKTALERGYTIAQTQNQRVVLTFCGPGSVHPNTYCYVIDDTKSEKPPLGSSYYTEVEAGVTKYYIDLQDGSDGLAIAATVSIVFDPQGTIMFISPAPGDVTVSRGGHSKTVTIYSNGDIKY